MIVSEPRLVPLKDVADLPIHPYADKFPYIPEGELLELAQDLEINGQVHPVTLYDGQILDGRNRLRALEQTNRDAVLVEDYIGDDPIGYIVSSNINRRMLSTGQRSALAVLGLPFYEEEAKKRMLSGKADPEQNSAEGRAPQARDIVAEKFSVSHDSVSRAKKLAVNRPDLFEEVLAGERHLNNAYEEMQNKTGPLARAGNKSGAKPGMVLVEYKDPVSGVVSRELTRAEATLLEKLHSVANVLIDVKKMAPVFLDKAPATEQDSARSAAIRAATLLAEVMDALEIGGEE